MVQIPNILTVGRTFRELILSECLTQILSISQNCLIAVPAEIESTVFLSASDNFQLIKNALTLSNAVASRCGVREVVERNLMSFR